MAKRITIDPITRIEGHLKIEVEIENGKVKEAWSSGTMARGFEALLLGKDPRDASYVTSRFCGVCFMRPSAPKSPGVGPFSETWSWGPSTSMTTWFTSIT